MTDITVTTPCTAEIEVPTRVEAEIFLTGIPGPPGPQGPPGTGEAAATHVHTQSTPSVTWVVDHNLGYFPNVTVVDSTGRQVEGDVDYATQNQVILSFSAAFSGKAYFS